jgi:peptidoglycan hydrolase-like protein with peptidoglycan-binding domain
VAQGPDAATRPLDVAPAGQDHARRCARVRILALAAIALAALSAAALIALRSGSPAHKASATGIPPGDTTTTVQRRTLVERAQVDGTLGYSGAFEIYDRLSGTFTWLPAVGAVIRRGGTLFKLDNLPVVLMYGAVPAYRALKLGVADGPDVAELNANLTRLGFDPYGAIAAGDHFSEATAAAVRRWQKADGLPQGGEVPLGRVVFAPCARRVTAVHPTLGQDPPPSSTAAQASAGGNGSGRDEPAEKSTKPAAKRPRAKAKHPHRPRRKDMRPTSDGSASKPTAGGKQQPAAKKPSSGEPTGGSGGAATPELALSTTATRQVVALQVKATEQQLARMGERAPVTLPNGDVVHGRITSVGTVASESSDGENEKGGGGGGGGESPSGGNGENATISATLTLDHPVARLDKAPISVELVKSVRSNVLAVSATALIATAGGGYAVEALNGARRVELPVTPGMFANGYVQIEGPGVHEGLTVIEPR